MIRNEYDANRMLAAARGVVPPRPVYTRRNVPAIRWGLVWASSLLGFIVLAGVAL